MQLLGVYNSESVPTVDWESQVDKGAIGKIASVFRRISEHRGFFMLMSKNKHTRVSFKYQEKASVFQRNSISEHRGVLTRKTIHALANNDT